MSKITNPHAAAAALIVGGALDEFVGKVYGVATALSDGTMTWNPDQGTEGRWNGGKGLYDMILAENLEVPSSYQGQISKIATGIKTLGAACIDKDNDRRMEAVRAFCSQYKTLNNMSSILYPTKDDGKVTTLAQMVANLYAWAAKNGHEVPEVVSEVNAQGEAIIAQG